MAADESHKRVLASIKTARKKGLKELRRADLDWEPLRIPGEIATLDRLESLSVNAMRLTDLSPIARLTRFHSPAGGEKSRRRELNKPAQ